MIELNEEHVTWTFGTLFASHLMEYLKSSSSERRLKLHDNFITQSMSEWPQSPYSRKLMALAVWRNIIIWKLWGATIYTTKGWNTNKMLVKMYKMVYNSCVLSLYCLVWWIRDDFRFILSKKQKNYIKTLSLFILSLPKQN